MLKINMRRVAQMDSAISSQEIGEWLGSLPPLLLGQIVMNANEIDHLLDLQKKNVFKTEIRIYLS